MFAALTQAYRNWRPLRASVPPVERQPERDWTVLVFMEGTDRLASSTQLALNKLEQVGSNSSVHVVVQATQRPQGWEWTSDLPNLPTRRYWVHADEQPEAVTSPVVQEFSEQLPANAGTLGDFLRWGMETFPSRHTLLIVKKHGAGFARLGERVPLSASELQEALHQAPRPLDAVAFDSCSMQQLEVAYQLRNEANVMFGSEEDILARTYPYGTTVACLAEGRNRPDQLVENYVSRTGGMQSALQLDRLPGLAGKVRSLVEAIVGSGVDPQVVSASFVHTPSMQPAHPEDLAHNFRDLGAFLQRVQGDSHYAEAVRRQAQETFQEFQGSLLASQAASTRKEPYGATVLLPFRPLSPHLRQEYARLDWVRDTGWLRLLDYAFQKPVRETPLPAAHGLGEVALQEYKRFVSPFLDTSCSYTPTCSVYAQQAVAHYGLRQGVPRAMLRFFSCDGHMHGQDPVAGSALVPMVARCAGLVGGLAGAALGSLAGAVTGWLIGSQRWTARTFPGETLEHGFANLSGPLLAHVPGWGPQGLAASLVGGAGGAALGFAWGHKLSEVWVEHRLQYAMGELPPSDWGRPDSGPRVEGGA